MVKSDDHVIVRSYSSRVAKAKYFRVSFLIYYAKLRVHHGSLVMVDAWQSSDC